MAISGAVMPKRGSLPKVRQLSIFQRDKWICHWCARPVVFAPTFKFLKIELEGNGANQPLAYFHPHWTRRHAPLLDALGAVLDHVKAYSSGGETDEENLITACNKCNGLKRATKAAEFAKRRPKHLVRGAYGEPEHWDGMSSLFVAFAERHKARANQSDRAWLAAMKLTPLQIAASITAKVES